MWILKYREAVLKQRVRLAARAIVRSSARLRKYASAAPVAALDFSVVS